MSSRGVDRLTPSDTRLKRCINCSFAIPRTLRTHSLEQASTPMINLLQSWIAPTQLTSECVLCTECLILLQDRANTISEGSSSLPAFGHRSICYPCGKSILRANRTYPVRQDRLERKILVKQVPLHLIEEDTANYMQYKIMNLEGNYKTVLRLKKGTVPHKFQCRKNTESQPSSEMEAYNKRKQSESIEKALSAPPAKQSVSNPTLTELSQIDIEIEAITSSSQVPRFEKACAACWRSGTREAQRCDQHSDRPGLSDPGPSGDLNFPESPPLPQQNKHTPQYEDSLQSDDGNDLPSLFPTILETASDDGNEIKIFCPKCNAEISHTAEGIQEEQIKIVIAKVYHYFEREYEELKKSFDGLEQTLLSKFGQRTALATGVSETTVLEILQEEARRNAEVREEPSPDESRARKRPWQTDTEREEAMVVKEEPAEEPPESYNDEPEIYVEMAEVKVEPGVSGANDSLADPISIDIKTEPWNEEATSSNTPVVQSATKKKKITQRNTEAPTAASAPPTPIRGNWSWWGRCPSPSPPRRRTNETPVVKSATKSYKRRKTKQNTEAPTVVSAPPTRNAPPAPPRIQNLLLDGCEVKRSK